MRGGDINDFEIQGIVTALKPRAWLVIVACLRRTCHQGGYHTDSGVIGTKKNHMDSRVAGMFACSCHGVEQQHVVPA